MTRQPDPLDDLDADDDADGVDAPTGGNDVEVTITVEHTDDDGVLPPPA